MNLLAVDLGNTNAKFGLFAGAALSEVHTARSSELQLGLAGEALRKHLDGVEATVFSSVSPAAEKALVQALADAGAPAPLRIRRDVPVRMHCLCDPPESVGDDRIVNAVAVYSITGGAAVVVDIGTAITVDAVTADGEFAGGAIALGVDSSARALHELTAQLPLIDPQPAGQSVGRNTKDAMNIGTVIGLAGLVDRLIEHVSGGLEAPQVLVTGGRAALLGPYIRSAYRFEEHLTLLGLKLIYEQQH